MNTVTRDVCLLHLSSLSAGLVAAGMSMPAMASAVDGGSVYSNCNPTSSVGNGNTANQSVAVGTFACASGEKLVAIGANTHAKCNSSLVIGSDDLDRVARGSSGPAGSTTNEAFNMTTDAKEFKNLTGQYLVDVQGGKRYISIVAGNALVAVGSITATSKDAVNGGQINTIVQSNKTLLGGAATVDTNGVVRSTNIGGTGATTIDGAISAANTQANKALTFTGNSGTTDQKLGSTLNIGGGATAASSNANVKTVVTNGNIDIQLVDAPTFAGQVKANGVDANGQKIVNVKARTDATDAVNVGQLKDAATGSVQYARDAITNAVNYNQVTLAGTTAVLGVNADGKSIVVSGGTKLSNVANGTVASDAVNKGQLDSVISANITDVIVTDAHGDPITVNVTE